MGKRKNQAAQAAKPQASQAVPSAPEMRATDLPLDVPDPGEIAPPGARDGALEPEDDASWLEDAEGQDGPAELLPDQLDAGRVPELPPVPPAPTSEPTHDPDPRHRESARIVEEQHRRALEPARPEGEAHHMGGPLYWFETRGADGQGFTRGLHTVELPPGPWRGFQAIAMDTEDNLVLAGHVVTHHRGQSAQISVQGASGWAPVLALVLVRDERAHVQAEAERA